MGLKEKKMCHRHEAHCGCGRHFLTTKEKIEHLEKYRKWLEMEGKGVEEALSKLEETS